MAYWASLYIGIGVLLGAGAFLTAEWIRPCDVPAPHRPGLLAVSAGVLWPVAVLGVAQVGVWMLAVRLLRSRVPAGIPAPRVRTLH